MKDDFYFTIAESTTSEYKEKGSRFLAFSYAVSSEQEIKDILHELKKKYYDARHICYGYIIGTEDRILKGQDDGEPSHTAGTPILNQIRSKNLTQTLVVVVRYFGGTKLGVSGLIESYKEAAKACLDKATILEKYISDTLEITFEAALQGEVMRLVKEFNGQILSLDYQSKIILQIEMRKSITPKFLQKPILGVAVEILTNKEQ
ncbi:IMPACT family protein [Cytophaga aurantiaca]|uniref:IMPACT family protein n=1 Tax=Cytophaga aurantiaca TaxID=29530 RepID=UPI0003656DC3|nr:YigZ family protein [Cytophaga aurantiaca]